jgi:hypothetical protein
MLDAMPSEDAEYVYRPPRWLTGVAIAASFVFAFFAVVSFATDMSIFFRVFFTLGTFASLAGIAETRIARVEVREECVFIANLLDTQKVAYTDVLSVKMEGGITALQLESGGWKKLPSWLGANASARYRINERLGSP